MHHTLVFNMALPAHAAASARQHRADRPAGPGDSAPAEERAAAAPGEFRRQLAAARASEGAAAARPSGRSGRPGREQADPTRNGGPAGDSRGADEPGAEPAAPAGATEQAQAAAGAPDPAAPAAAAAARAGGEPVAPAVLAAMAPGGQPQAAQLPAAAVAYGARTLQQQAGLAAAAPATAPAQAAGLAGAADPAATAAASPAATGAANLAAAGAAGLAPAGAAAAGAAPILAPPDAAGLAPGGSGVAGAPGGQTISPAPDAAAAPTLADLAALVADGAARLDQPAGGAEPVPADAAGAGQPGDLTPAEAAEAAAHPPAAAAAPAPGESARATGPAAAERPLLQVDPRLVAEQVATAARRASLSLAGDRSELRLRLWPRELGELDLKLVMENGALRADVVVSRPEVKAALESNLADLRQRLAQQGLSVESFQVALGGGNAGGHGQPDGRPDRSRRLLPIRPIDLADGLPAAAMAMAAAPAATGFGPRGRRFNGWA